MSSGILSFVIGTICSIPFFMGLFIGLAYRRHPQPPRWAIALLASVCLACTWQLFTLPGIPDAVSIPFVTGATACGTVALAMMIRRARGIPLPRALLLVLLPVLPAMAWIDFRFRMIVQDSAGNRVEIETREAGLEHEPSGYLDTHDYGWGKRAAQGTVYYGYIVWLRHKDGWKLPFRLAGTDQKFHAVHNYEPLGWSAWPKVVIVDPES